MGTRVFISDGHEILRGGLKWILEKQARAEIVGEADTAAAGVQAIIALRPDVAIIDLADPLGESMDAIRTLLEEDLPTKFIVLAGSPDRNLLTECLRLGVRAILARMSASVELLIAMQAVRRGETYLSPRFTSAVVHDFVRATDGATNTAFASLTAKQREVLQLLSEGKTNKEAAACLGISTKTVEAHRAQLMEKLNIHTIAELTKYAIREGLTSVEF